MALKSSREGLRKELVDYLGNIIIDENLKQNIINSVDDVFINNEELTTSVNELDGKIRNEASVRSSADITLQENINAETSARSSADITLQENINTETSARTSADINLSDTKANKSDVLTLEEIQASTDLTGKIASASSVKTISDITNLMIDVPYTVMGKLNMINNCKYISSIIESYKPRMLIISNSGSAFIIGFTYAQSESTPYAMYFYFTMGYEKPAIIMCFNSQWTYIEFTGSVLWLKLNTIIKKILRK